LTTHIDAVTIIIIIIIIMVEGEAIPVTGSGDP
jgi:hypothetical protein